MSASQIGRPTAGGAVAFGVALVFAVGGFGFYRLTEIARPGPAVPPAARPVAPAGEELAPPALVIPVFPAARDAEADPAADPDPDNDNDD